MTQYWVGMLKDKMITMLKFSTLIMTSQEHGSQEYGPFFQTLPSKANRLFLFVFNYELVCELQL